MKFKRYLNEEKDTTKALEKVNDKLLIDTTKALAKYVKAYDYVIEKNIINVMSSYIYFYPINLSKPEDQPDDTAVIIHGYHSVVPGKNNEMLKKVIFDIDNPYVIRTRNVLFIMPEELKKLKRKLNTIRTKTKIGFLKSHNYRM